MTGLKIDNCLYSPLKLEVRSYGSTTSYITFDGGGDCQVGVRQIFWRVGTSWYHLHLVSLLHDFLPPWVFWQPFHISFFSFELYRAQAAQRFKGRRYCFPLVSTFSLLDCTIFREPALFFPLLFCFCLAGDSMGSGFDTILHRSSFLPMWERVWSSVFISLSFDGGRIGPKCNTAPVYDP